MNALAHALLVSSRAAAREGPTIGRPGCLERVDDAKGEGKLGTDDGQADTVGAGEGHQRFRLGEVGRRFGPTSEVPALPGAQRTPETPASRASVQARACSRAPFPSTRIFTDKLLPK
jgi:hypothetical protein